eukprot:g7728.t1
MPPNSLVGLITYGALVNVHELGFSEMNKSHAFVGTKEYLLLGVGMRNDPRRNTRSDAAKRFLLPINECGFAINSALEDLKPDRWPVESAKQRTQRCTGGALNIAVGLLENCYAGHSGRITRDGGEREIVSIRCKKPIDLRHQAQKTISPFNRVLLVSGPCTAGPGAIVSRDKREALRSHLDLTKDQPNARYSKSALVFYTTLAARAISIGHAVDIFAASLDQTGLHEMRCMVEKTGGHMVMADGFSQHVFRDSFTKMLTTTDSSAEVLDMGFNARMSIVVSKEVKVCGAIGPLCSLQKGHPTVSEQTVIGEGNTTVWACSALDRGSSVAFYFEVVDDRPSHVQAAFLQFQTLYHHPSGKKRLRVTNRGRWKVVRGHLRPDRPKHPRLPRSPVPMPLRPMFISPIHTTLTIDFRFIKTVARAYSDPQLMDIGAAFDQECAAVLLARFCMHQAESTESFDTLRRLDRMLIRI